MSAQPAEIDDDKDALEWELIELVEEHGSERAALRALLHDFHALLADADRLVSHGYVRGRQPWRRYQESLECARSPAAAADE